jgi:hypothetical protein
MKSVLAGIPIYGYFTFNALIGKLIGMFGNMVGGKLKN